MFCLVCGARLINDEVWGTYCPDCGYEPLES